MLTREHLAEDRMKTALAISPITVQEYIPGTNIRTYVMGEDVFSAEIASEAVDFREDDGVRITAIPTPADIAELSRTIMREFGMLWTAIDWRRTPSGEYVFLEANPSPMFHHFEMQTDYPICQRLTDLLID